MNLANELGRDSEQLIRNLRESQEELIALKERNQILTENIGKLTDYLNRYRNLAISYGAPMKYVTEIDLERIEPAGGTDQ